MHALHGSTKHLTQLLDICAAIGWNQGETTFILCTAEGTKQHAGMATLATPDCNNAATKSSIQDHDLLAVESFTWPDSLNTHIKIAVDRRVHTSPWAGVILLFSRVCAAPDCGQPGTAMPPPACAGISDTSLTCTPMTVCQHGSCSYPEGAGYAAVRARHRRLPGRGCQFSA
jgi:hypothetical protein